MQPRSTTLMEELLSTIREKTANGIPLEKAGVLTRFFDGVPKEKFLEKWNEFYNAYREFFGEEAAKGKKLILLNEENAQALLAIMKSILNSITSDADFNQLLKKNSSSESFSNAVNEIGIALLNRITGRLVDVGGEHALANMGLVRNIFVNHYVNQDDITQKVEQEFKTALEAAIFSSFDLLKNVENGKTTVILSSVKENTILNNLENLEKYKQDLEKNASGKPIISDPNFSRVDKALVNLPLAQKSVWVHKAQYDVLKITVDNLRTAALASVDKAEQKRLNDLCEKITKVAAKYHLALQDYQPSAKHSTSAILKSFTSLISKNEIAEKKPLDLTAAIEKPTEKTTVNFKEGGDAKKSVTFGRGSQVIPNAVHKDAERYALMSKKGLMQSQGDLKAALREKGSDAPKEEKKDTPSFKR